MSRELDVLADVLSGCPTRVVDAFTFAAVQDVHLVDACPRRGRCLSDRRAQSSGND
jgi:hypothetical protein